MRPRVRTLGFVLGELYKTQEHSRRTTGGLRTRACMCVRGREVFPVRIFALRATCSTFSEFSRGFLYSATPYWWFSVWHDCPRRGWFLFFKFSFMACSSVCGVGGTSLEMCHTAGPCDFWSCTSADASRGLGGLKLTSRASLALALSRSLSCSLSGFLC